MPIPVVFLVFANDTTEPLPCLKEERQAIEGVAARLNDADELKLVVMPDASRDRMFTRLSGLQSNRNPVRIFHFSGHAGGTQLLLEDGVIQADGVARLTKLFRDPMGASSLKLVFLNGCATAPQVQALHKMGVPAVIATERPINDTIAADFAGAFYRAFLQEVKTLETAFEWAVGEITAKYEIKAAPAIFQRGLYWEEAPEGFPWGLYIAKGKDRILRWRFPLSTVPEATDVPEVNGGMNRVFAALLDAGVKAPVPSQGQKELSFEDKKEFIIDEFSWLIGVPLRRLFTAELDNHSRERLLRIADTYVAAIRFLAYTLLSQVAEYDALRKDERLAECLPIEAERYSGYDYWRLLRTCHDLLAEKEAKPFIREITPLLERIAEERELAEIFAFMESARALAMQSHMANQLEADAYADLSAQAETALTELLVQLAFLGNYRLRTVTDIEVLNLRFQAPKYEHVFGELHGIYESFEGFEAKMEETFSNSHSVLLLADRPAAGTPQAQSLNLSPLVIDNNAYTSLELSDYRARTPHILCYAWSKTEGTPAHIFLDINYDPLEPQPNSRKSISKGNNDQPKLDRVYEQLKRILPDHG